MNQYTLHRAVPVPMRDGTTLRADVWLPDSSGRWPVLLERTPYDRSSSFMSQHVVGLEALRALDAGFAVVIQDTRGRFGSEGTFDPFTHEADDGEDTVAWVRRQGFSDGRVAMFGASYIGATQMLAASRQPEGLQAVAPQLTASEYYEGWTYSGGAFQLGFAALWVIDSLAGPDLDRRSALPPGTREAFEELRRSPAAAFEHLPTEAAAMARVAPYWRDWVGHPERDAFWAAIDPSASFLHMGVAGLHIGGWYDLFLEGTLRNYLGLRREAATEWARGNQYLVVGPWSHGNPSDWQGDLWHGYDAAAAALDLTAVHLEFFRATLGSRPPELPRVRLFTTGVDKWQEADDWPVPGARQEALYLDSDGQAATPGRSGELAPTPPTGDAPGDTWISDPMSPVPTCGGPTFLPGLLLGRNSGPKDQAAIEARPDVAVYTGPVLGHDMEVTGEVVLELYAATDGTDCDWTARLVDVAPDGTSRGIVDGVLRARYRHGLDRPTPLVPGSPELFRVALGSVSHVFKAGHRARLQVASSNFPRFDRNPQAFVPVASAPAETFRVARQTVFHDAHRPSRLLLPVRPRQ